jgi:ubiquinone/menaquinone biosynthesis C-methylase UbiE
MTTTTHSIDLRLPEDAARTFDHGRRGRFNAWFFTAFDRYANHIAARHKRHAFGDLTPGTIVEIGAGVGANFDHVPEGSRLIAIEPNVAMHDGLLRRASERDVAIELVADDAHLLPLADDSVDDVMCSLVLCTVADPDAVLAEVRRVLRPGGRFRFVEHVAAAAWSPRRWLQHALRRPWSWVYEGCDTCRDTASTIERAGFARVELERRRFRHSCFVPVNTAIAGVATN